MSDLKTEVERILLLDLKRGDVLIDPLGPHGEIVFTDYIYSLRRLCIAYETRNHEGCRTGTGSMTLWATLKFQRATDVKWPKVKRK